LVKALQYYLVEIVTEKEYISQCKKQIGQKLNLGSEMMERDYEYLHEVILKKTRTDLSTSTLRRIWSDKYQSIPQAKTLDALAQFLDHSGWHAFKNSFPRKANTSYQTSARSVLYLVGIFLVVSSIIVLTSSDKAIGEVILEPELKHHEGVPATIGFHYNVKNPNIDIELSWNPYERTVLDMEGDFYTGTYYYPDYHMAKLIFDEQILIQKPVHITTAYWHGLIMDEGYDSSPVYLDSVDYLFEDKLSISKETIQQIGLDTKQSFPLFTLSHSDLSSISGDSFILNARIKSEPFSKEQICLVYEVLLKGVDGSIRVPISQTGCYGLGDVKCSNKVLSGKLNDLSALSTDLSTEHQITFVNKNNQLRIEVANNNPLLVDYDDAIGELKVIKFIFQGAAEILSFELLDESETRFQSSALRPF
jgi:transcriptional regulator with XRE-family HTH domain